MAFPTTGILDNFNRADENPLATSSSGPAWSSGDIWGFFARLKLVSNQCTPIFASGVQNSQYIGSYGPDSEAYVTFATAPAGSGDNGVWLRMVTPGGNQNGYFVSYVPSASGVKAYRCDTGTLTQLGATFSQTVSNGDSLGADMVSTSLTSYYKSGAGSWSTLGSRTDGTYSAAGAVGLDMFDASAVADNFGGGTTVTGGGGPPNLLVPRAARIAYT